MRSMIRRLAYTVILIARRKKEQEEDYGPPIAPV
jgi:hypothetical protein